MSDDDRWPVFLEDESRPEATGQPRLDHRRKSHTLARVTHTFGEILLTVGAVLLLFVAYTLWWTGVETGNEQQSLRNDLENQWASEQPQPGISVAPGTTTTTTAPPGLAEPAIGDGVAILRIPRFGPDYAWVVVEGIDITNLARGPGHYPQTSLPGEIGNFAVAGHRATHGEPFARFEELRTGDPVVVETATEWYTYQITKIDYPVPIESGWALDPSPLDLGQSPTKAMMTMTTCHPRWASTFRFLVFSELVNTTAKTDASGDDQLPPVLQGFGTGA